MICNDCMIRRICKLRTMLNILQENGQVDFKECKVKNDINQNNLATNTKPQLSKKEKIKKILDFNKSKNAKIKNNMVKCPNCNEETYEEQIIKCDKCGKQICDSCGVIDMETNKLICEECWDN